MKNKLFVVAVVLVVVVGLYLYLRQPAGVVISTDEQLQALNAPAPSNNFVLPAVKWLKNGELDLSGPVEYKVSFGSMEGLTMSKIVFDPYDVNPGDTQNIYVIGKYAGGVSGVTASIKTDKGVVPLQLALAQGDAKNGVWKGSWTAKDVHPGYYTVDFTATSADGKSRGASAAFLDGLLSDIFAMSVYADYGVNSGCNGGAGFSATGTVTLSGSCTLNGSDAVVNGNLTLSSGASLVVPATFVFGFSSGYSISLCPSLRGSCSISIASGGKIVKMGVAGAGGVVYNAYVEDKDGDKYWDNQDVTSTNPYGAGGYLRSTPGLLGGGDCYDAGTNAALANPGQLAWVTSSARGDGSWDYDCNSIVENSGWLTEECRKTNCRYDAGYCQDSSCDIVQNPTPPSCGSQVVQVSPCDVDYSGEHTYTCAGGAGEATCYPGACIYTASFSKQGCH